MDQEPQELSAKEKLGRRFQERLKENGRKRVLDVLMEFAEPVTEALASGIKYQEIWEDMTNEGLRVRSYQAFTRALCEFRSILSLPNQREVKRTAGRFLRKREDVLSDEKRVPEGTAGRESPDKSRQSGLETSSMKKLMVRRLRATSESEP